MPITLSGDGITSDNITSLAASKLTGQVPDANAPSGSVIQVVNGFTSTNVTTTSVETWVDTGITATITPQFSTSNILVLINPIGMQKDSGTHWNRMAFRLMRNSTTLHSGAAQLWSYNTDFYFRSAGAFYSKLDSPGSTSALTYKMQFLAENLSNGNGVSIQKDSNSGESQIFLMEIAA
jgi:hypothetical protein